MVEHVLDTLLKQPLVLGSLDLQAEDSIVRIVVLDTEDPPQSNADLATINGVISGVFSPQMALRVG